MYKQQFISISIFVKIFCRFLWSRKPYVQRIVHKKRFTAFHVVRLRFDIKPYETHGIQAVLYSYFGLYRIRLPFLPDTGWWIQVIYQRRKATKSLRAYQFLLVKLSIGLAAHSVAFFRYCSERMIKWHIVLL